jgi:hypothetical protein
MRKLDWNQDGSDLMDKAEIYYLEAINTHRWGRKAYKQDVQYAFKATSSETETKEEKVKPKNNSYEEMIKALTAQLQEQTAAYTARCKEQDLPLVPTSQSMDHPYSSRMQEIKTNQG